MLVAVRGEERRRGKSCKKWCCSLFCGAVFLWNEEEEELSSQRLDRQKEDDARRGPDLQPIGKLEISIIYMHVGLGTS